MTTGARRKTLDPKLDLLTIRFGPQPPSVAERLAGASPAELLRWSERVLSAERIDGIFG